MVDRGVAEVRWVRSLLDDLVAVYYNDYVITEELIVVGVVDVSVEGQELTVARG